MTDRPAAYPTDNGALSPSLRAWTPGAPRAYEMKFLLTEPEASLVESLVAPRLALDPHADPDLGNAYRTTTLYCDTPAFDVLRRIGSHKRRKYRLRRYGGEPTLFLERKSKRGERVRKRRSTIDERELPRFDEPAVEAEWSGGWFHAQAVRRALRPVIRVQYVRTAYFGDTSDGPIRVTFDRDIRGVPTSEWCVTPFADGAAALQDRIVCEFKFHGTLPASLRSVIQTLRLSPCGVSKYRHCAAAAGIVKESPHDA